ncbi:oxidoreductase [Achromatium sp. WMS2]|nr:oxidoreductase [Achromatium sp. WMS2]
MRQTILLTGATGFVGTQILKHLANFPVDIHVVVRKQHDSGLSSISGITKLLFTSDLFSESSGWLEHACLDVDTVVHAAWYVTPGKYLQAPQNLDCLNGTVNLAKACVKAGVRRFIGIGTCFEYDLTANYLSVQTPLKPETLYAATKAATFFSLSQYFGISNVEFAWCRLFYLYGEGEDERRLVPYLRKKLALGEKADLTSGQQIRDFLDVSKAGQMIADIALNNQQGPVNVCSGIPITVKNLAEQIADEYGKRELLNFGARPDNVIDPPCVVGIR